MTENKRLNDAIIKLIAIVFMHSWKKVIETERKKILPRKKNHPYRFEMVTVLFEPKKAV